MDSDKDNNTMYKSEWNKKELLKSADLIIEKTLNEKQSNILYIDDLGDFFRWF